MPVLWGRAKYFTTSLRKNESFCLPKVFFDPIVYFPQIVPCVDAVFLEPPRRFTAGTKQKQDNH